MGATLSCLYIGMGAMGILSMGAMRAMEHFKIELSVPHEIDVNSHETSFPVGQPLEALLGQRPKIHSQPRWHPVPQCVQTPQVLLQMHQYHYLAPGPAIDHACPAVDYVVTYELCGVM